MKKEKTSLLRNGAVQSLLASLLCIILGLVVGYIALLLINPAGANGAILAIVENFMTYSKSTAQLRYFGSTLVKTAPLLMCSLSVLFAYKVGLFNIGAAGQYVVGTGAALYCALGLKLPWFLCLIAAILAGAALGAVSGVLKAYCNVNEVISSLRMPLLGITLIAAFCLMGLVYMFGAKPAGWSLLIAGCATLGLFALVGLWAAFGFDGFFAVLHGLFFSEGTWTFPADSLLIQMYPQGFWMGMGLWWLSASCITAVASIVIGYLIVRKRKPNAAETFVPAGQQA